MAVMPSDHVIHPAEAFRAAIRQAAALVDAAPGDSSPSASSPRIRRRVSATSSRARRWPIRSARPPRTGSPASVESPRRASWPGNTSPPARISGTPGSSSGRPRPAILDALAIHQPECLAHSQARSPPPPGRRPAARPSSLRNSSIPSRESPSTTPSWRRRPTWPSSRPFFLGRCGRLVGRRPARGALTRPAILDRRPPPGHRFHRHDRAYRRRPPRRHDGTRGYACRTPRMRRWPRRAHEEAVRKVVAELGARGWNDYL